MSLTKEQLKNQLRITAKQARMLLTEEERADKSRLICERIIRHILLPVLSGMEAVKAETKSSEPKVRSAKNGKTAKSEGALDLEKVLLNCCDGHDEAYGGNNVEEPDSDRSAGHSGGYISGYDLGNDGKHSGDGVREQWGERGSVSVKWGNESVILAYMPHQTEVDVTPLMEWCWSRGIDVALPKTEPERRLSLWVVRHFDQLESGTWGLREPGPAATPLQEWSRIGLALVPGLAFDRKRGRLGYGGGYYDRFFATFRERTGEELFKLAPAFETQLVDEVPMDRHDFRVDGIMTECSYIC